MSKQENPRQRLREAIPYGRQRAAAVRLGISEPYLSQILRGNTPSLRVAAAIEREYGIPAASWVEAA